MLEINSVLSFDRLRRQRLRWGVGVRDNSAEILLQYFLQEVLVSSLGIGRDVYSLMFLLGTVPSCRNQTKGNNSAGVCCCVPCLSSAIIFVCSFYTGALGLTLFQITTIHSEAYM